MNHVGKSTSGNMFKASTAQWVPSPNKNANVLKWVFLPKKQSHTEKRKRNVLKYWKINQIHKSIEPHAVKSLWQRDGGGNFWPFDRSVTVGAAERLGLIMTRINTQFRSFTQYESEGCWEIRDCHKNSLRGGESTKPASVHTSCKGVMVSKSCFRQDCTDYSHFIRKIPQKTETVFFFWRTCSFKKSSCAYTPAWAASNIGLLNKLIVKLCVGSCNNYTWPCGSLKV